MICAKCSGKTTVADTRYSEQCVYRERVCKQCGDVSYTIEKPVEHGDDVKARILYIRESRYYDRKNKEK